MYTRVVRSPPTGRSDYSDCTRDNALSIRRENARLAREVTVRSIFITILS
jgi:hypothetical protein